jgi:hypothetical protein
MLCNIVSTTQLAYVQSMYIAVLMLHQCGIFIYTLAAVAQYQRISFKLLLTSAHVHREDNSATILLIL